MIPLVISGILLYILVGLIFGVLFIQYQKKYDADVYAFNPKFYPELSIILSALWPLSICMITYWYILTGIFKILRPLGFFMERIGDRLFNKPVGD